MFELSTRLESLSSTLYGARLVPIYSVPAPARPPDLQTADGNINVRHRLYHPSFKLLLAST